MHRIKIFRRGQRVPFFFQMITTDRIKELAEEVLSGTKHFITEIDITPAGKISVYADSFEKFTISDCVKVSKHIRKTLGEELDDYEMTVSSAGMDRPFRDSRQYHKNIGRELQVLLTDGVVHKGILSEVQPDYLVLTEVPKAPKKGMKPKVGKEEKRIQINFEQIKETKRVINFK